MLHFLAWNDFVSEMYNTAIIWFGFRMVARILKASVCYPPKPSASADNTNQLSLSCSNSSKLCLLTLYTLGNSTNIIERGVSARISINPYFHQQIYCDSRTVYVGKFIMEMEDIHTDQSVTQATRKKISLSVSQQESNLWSSEHLSDAGDSWALGTYNYNRLKCDKLPAYC